MTTTLRVLTFNLWNGASDVDKRMEVGVAAVRALRPDVIGLQEVLEIPGGLKQAEQFAEAIGGRAYFAAAHQESPGGPIGNAIVSRLPMSNPGTLRLGTPDGDYRIAVAADIETPAGMMGFITTHLSWELEASPLRERQVIELDAFAKTRKRELPTVMTGDFNATPDTDSIRFLTGRASLEGKGTYWRDAFARVHPHDDGYTWSANNPYIARHVERNRRIDYVFVGPLGLDERGAILDARVVLDVPGPDGTYPSDHFGVLVQIDLEPRTGGR